MIEGIHSLVFKGHWKVWVPLKKPFDLNPGEEDAFERVCEASTPKLGLGFRV